MAVPVFIVLPFSNANPNQIENLYHVTLANA